MRRFILATIIFALLIIGCFMNSIIIEKELKFINSELTLATEELNNGQKLSANSKIIGLEEYIDKKELLLSVMLNYENYEEVVDLITKLRIYSLTDKDEYKKEYVILTKRLEDLIETEGINFKGVF